MDIHALHKRGWTISAIARHIGRDRKTVRSYLNGERVAGQRKPAGPDAFAPYLDYVTARLREDPHLWAVALFDEVRALGYDRSYPTFTRAIRTRGLRPVCVQCRQVGDRPTAVIEHPAGDETQWDWVDLPNPPASWDGFGTNAHLLVGALSHSGQWRGVLCEAMDQAQLVDAQYLVAVKLGGITRDWRFDRMATVVNPATRIVTASYAQIAKHYGVKVIACPPRRGNRKGVVEKANHQLAQRWWRTLPDDVTLAEAHASLDRFCQTVADQRQRVDDNGSQTTVAEMAAAEGLTPVPLIQPIVSISAARQATGQALVHYRGNYYSVPPEHARTEVIVTHRTDEHTITITTTADTPIAVHQRRPDGAKTTCRIEAHITALDTAAMAAAASPGRPHRRKERIPPGTQALAAAAILQGHTPPAPSATVTDLTAWSDAAKRRRTLPPASSATP